VDDVCGQGMDCAIGITPPLQLPLPSPPDCASIGGMPINCTIVPLTAGTITALVSPAESYEESCGERSGAESVSRSADVESSPGSEQTAEMAQTSGDAPGDGVTYIGCWARHRTVFVERGGWFILLINFISGFEIAGLETTATPLTEQYHWHTMENSLLFAGIASVALVSVIITALARCFDANGPQEQRVRPRRLIACGFASYGVAFAVGFTKCTPSYFAPEWMLTFGALYVFGIPLSMSPAMAIFSSKISDHRKGEYMGLASLVQGAGRIAGPLLASATFHVGSFGHWPLFLTLGLVYAMGPALLPCAWNKLVLDLEE